MKNIKKLLALTLTTFTLTSASAFAIEFNDNFPDWAAGYFDNLSNNGFFYDFWSLNSAQEPITRGEFSHLLTNLIQAEMSPSQFRAVPPKESSYFVDTASTVVDYNIGGDDKIYYSASYGIVDGTEIDGKLYADSRGLLTREQAAKMMCSVTDYLEENVLNGSISQSGDAKVFADASKISPWAAPYVERAAAMGIIVGDENGNFNPLGNITWSEASVMVSQAFDKAIQLKGENMSKDNDTLLHSQNKFDIPLVADIYSDEAYTIYESDGSFTLVYDIDGKVYIESFSKDGNSEDIRTLPEELPIFVTFLETDDAFYIAYAQDNDSESESAEVYRIVKYDRNWNRVNSASVDGKRSRAKNPAYHTDRSVLAEEDGVLVFHTAQREFKLKADGVNHQSNYSMTIDTSDMSILWINSENPFNHVSHSFSQDVIFADGAPVFADLGDAYPRGFTISQYNDNGYGNIQQNVMPFYGKIGDNTTNAVLGGLEASEDYYLLAGASAPQTDEATWKKDYQNAMLAISPKNGFPKSTPTIKWLTNYTDGKQRVDEVNIVAVNNNTFVVMWQEHCEADYNKNGAVGDFCYAVFDGKGNQVGETKRLPDYRIPRSNVVINGDTIMWARPYTGGEAYTGSYAYKTESKKVVIYTLDINANEQTQIQGEKTELTVNPTSLEMSARQKPVKLEVKYTGISGETPKITYSSSDYNVANVDNDGNVQAKAEGKATITASMTYRGVTYKGTCAVTVTKPQSLTSFTVEPSSKTIKVGESVKIKAVAEPADLDPYITWSYSGRYGTLTDMTSDGFTYTATKVGTDSFDAYATDFNNNKYKASCTITVVDDNSTQNGDNTNTENNNNTNTGNNDNNNTSNGNGDTNGTDDSVTSSPAKPYDTDVYREDYGNGYYMQVKVLDNDTVEFSGRMDLTQGIYTYAVVSGDMKKHDTPYIQGEEFFVTSNVDLSLVKRAEDNGYDYGLTAMVCQHYKPGDTVLGGISFRNAYVNLIPDGNGFKLSIKPR